VVSRFRFALAAAALALAGIAFAAAPVAFVTDVQGEARVSGAGKVAFLAEFAPMTTLVLEKGARVTLIYSATGAEFALVGPGEFTIEAGEVRALKGAAPSRRNVAVRPDATVVARVSQSATASIRMRSITPAPKADPNILVYPRDTRISMLQPTLRWSSEKGKAYAIAVSGADGKEVWRGTANAGSIKVGMKLSPGTHYKWSVSSGGTGLGEVRFETLPSEAIAKAEKSRAGAKSFSDRTVHAFVLHDLGAAQEAKDAWAALYRERPDLPELAALAK
jgi:hypothetical protein